MSAASNEIFVFGSNLDGRHGKGAALCARNDHGAKYGQGRGLQGNSYAIPTKSHTLRPLTLGEINHYVAIFLDFAREHPELVFNITPIGCGWAGYTPQEIAPMFRNHPPNCNLPMEFKPFVN